MRVLNSKRIRRLNQATSGSGPVIYWMQRDQRVSDNWAFSFSCELADIKKQPLIVVFNIVEEFARALPKHYSFMLKSLKGVSYSLAGLGVLFIVMKGSPCENISAIAEKYGASAIVADFNPLKIVREWKSALIRRVDIPLFEVDAHNIVPCWIASQKQEYGAYTIRPRIKKMLPEFLTVLPSPEKRKIIIEPDQNPTDILDRELMNIGEKSQNGMGAVYGEAEALTSLSAFISKKLERYHTDKNDPNSDAVSGLSHYLHFGIVSAQRIALDVMSADVPDEARESFLEELIIRRELSDNFCFYNPGYDSFAGLPEWSKKTLIKHAGDRREYTYSYSDLENSMTHDELWNAAQRQMVNKGKMHGYMRMYWAKKILEWTASPQEAVEICIRLNDTYEYDGRDPNGYAGCLWAVGGLHDRPWKEREIFGNIRYMNRRGCERKFDVERYIKENS